MAIPVGKTIIYVEPIYLQSETAAYPELRLVAVMHNDNLSYAESFDEALKGIYGEPVKKVPGKEAKQTVTKNQRELIQSANKALKEYLQYTGEQKFDEAAKSLSTLKEILEKLEQQGNQSSR